MAKITLGDIVSGYATVQALNLNFSKIENYLNEVALARTHEAGEENSMNSPLDMGDNDILNAGVVHLNGIQYNGRDLLGWIEESITYIDELKDSITSLQEDVITSIDDFKDKYYGAYPSHPNINPYTGQAIEEGAMYFNSVTKIMYAYDSITGWKDIGKGAKGDRGEIPDHNWDGTEVRFELPDGTFGPYVDLKGDIGPKGDKGDIGPKGDKGDRGEVGPVGPKGDKGDIGERGPQGFRGDSFSVDAVGYLADRVNFDDKPAGFVFFAQDQSIIADDEPVYQEFEYSPTGTYTLDDQLQGQQTLTVMVNNIVQSPSAYSFTSTNDGYFTLSIDAVQGDTIVVREVGSPSVFGVVFFKKSNALGDWSDAVPFGRGPQGDVGATGPKGDQGEKGEEGEEGPVGPEGPKGDKGDKGDTPAHVWDGTSLSFENKDGTMGTPVNLIGPQGLRGFKGDDGVDGTNGVDGVNGNSAYEDAVALGYVGTLPQWIASLKGEKGADGVDGNDAELPQDTQGQVKGLRDGQWVDVLQDLPTATASTLGGIKAKVEGKTLYISLGSADA